MKNDLETSQRQSSPLDVVVFGAAVFIGFAVYLVFRLLLGGRAQVPITLTLVAIMISYSLIVARVARVRLRLDQAGDNAYYLGLLFTLGSMAFALWDFHLATVDAKAASGVQQIISNFGIALATTVFGIFLRVALHQMRVDPADLETMTRVELTEAAERLRGMLDTSTTSLGRFHLELQQRQSDVMTEMVERMSGTAAQMHKAVADSSARVILQTEESYKAMIDGTQQVTLGLKSLALEATGAVDRLRSVAPPPLTLSRRLDKIGEVMERIATQSERTAAAFQAAVGETATAVHSINETAGLLKALTAQMRDEHVDITTNIGKAANALTRELEPFNNRLKDILADVAQLHDRVNESTNESVRAQKAAIDVISSLTTVTRELTSVIHNSGPHVGIG